MTSPSAPDEQRVQMAARLKEAREYLGLSQDQTAMVLKISRPAVSNIESGARKVEAVELDQLSQLYGRSVSYFLSGVDTDQTPSDKVAFYARTLKDLSKRDLNEVARFADFLRSANKKHLGKSRS
jgi:transcriptional regulator with XRE-family HTH domain